MPYYRISLMLKSKSAGEQDRRITVYRQYSEYDIEKVWHQVEMKCREKWKESLREFECIGFSKRSGDYQRYLEQLGAAKRSGNEFGLTEEENGQTGAGSRKKGAG